MAAADVLSPATDPSIDVLALSEFLNIDSRPCFVLHSTRKSPINSERWELVFFNKALEADEALLRAVRSSTCSDKANALTEERQHFERWLSDTRHSSQELGISCGGTFWTSTTVRKQYQIVSGNASQAEVHHSARHENLARNPHARETRPTLPDRSKASVRVSSQRSEQLASRYDPKPPPSSEDTKLQIPAPLPTSKTTDWTAEHPSGMLSPFEIFARNVDWSLTPLGAMSSWSPVFREVANLVMRNPHPAAIFWGPELNMMYNEPYALEVAGNKHPGLMGSGFFGPFAELWETIKPIFEACARTGKSIRKENDKLLMERYGYLEETFFSWSWTPLYGGTDKILGFYNAPLETTYQTLSIRRMETLRHLGESVASARSVRQFWKRVLSGLSGNPFDIPFATLYSVTNFDDSDTTSVSSSSFGPRHCTLEGTIAVPDDHLAARPNVDLFSQDDMAPLLRAAAGSHDEIILRTSDQTLPEFLLSGINFGGFEIPSREALLMPIRSADGNNTVAVLLIGLNPRRQYDEGYQMFISMLNRQVKTSLAALLRLEDELKANRTAAELAALQREKLTEELALQTSRLRRMTELSPIGLFLISPDGMLLEGNDRYYELTGLPRDTVFFMSFMDSVYPSCMPAAIAMWQGLTVDQKPQTAEIQLKNNFNTEKNEATGLPIDCWVLAFCSPEMDEDGNIRSIMGSIADISHMKWAQSLQDQRLREVEETKRQQNAFIDITSHEMRNPLSAVLICADDIRETLSQHLFARREREVVESCIDAANTIALCVQHQKAIVDDILTISKLNSNLLVISPITTQPTQTIQQAMKMFKNEAQSQGIDLTLTLHPSLDDLGVNWLMLDPGRLLQITINLITNAIKFTRDSQRRSISVAIGASLSPPLPTTKNFQYIPTRVPHKDVANTSDWGSDELLYLRVKVADTGRGLTEEEKQRLFERFSQANPRTHAEYGGSGLGLFISRELAELHGGQIGCSSEAGVGSVFGFFIQCRKSPDKTPSITSSPALDSRPSPNPVKRKVASDTRLLASVQEASLSNSRPVTELDSNSLHVLVVEDNLVNQKILKKQLQKLGCVVDTADNGVHALEYLKTTDLYDTGARKISLILMDWEMPEMDGLTCVEHIRKLEASGTLKRRIPVVAVTANVRAEQIAAARSSGMDDVVSKPFRVAELMTRIENIVSQALTTIDG